MGVFASKFVYARHRHGASCANDRTKAQNGSHLDRGKSWLSACLITLSLASSSFAETIRVAVYNVPLSRKGPGLLLRDILKGQDEAIIASASVIAKVRPDIILLTGIDYDHSLTAAKAYADVIGQQGVSYPFLFARRPNTGRPTGQDINANSYLGDAADAHGYGSFAGYSGMVLMSRYPVVEPDVVTFTDVQWGDLSRAKLPNQKGIDFRTLRLSTTAHWDVPIQTPLGDLNVLAHYATPPVFDGPEDRNGLRNADELNLWAWYLDGKLQAQPPIDFVLLASANLDPSDGDGRHDTMAQFLARPDIIDPLPTSAGAVSNADVDHRGDPALDTTDWKSPPGNLRVDYVLPSSTWRVVDAGVFWPTDSALLGSDGNRAGRHRLVWVDLSR